jgi:5-methylcytosine-specific restriction endonuclease McrA
MNDEVTVIDLSDCEWRGPYPAEWTKHLRWKWKSYEHYRRSALWRDIKARVMARDNHQCQRCGGKPVYNEYGEPDFFLEVHHRSYLLEVMHGFNDYYLVTLCEGCHHQVHFDKQSRKRSHQGSERVVDVENTRTDFPKPKIDLRRQPGQLPSDVWNWMNLNQRRGFLEWEAKMRAEKAEKRAKRR